MTASPFSPNLISLTISLSSFPSRAANKIPLIVFPFLIGTAYMTVTLPSILLIIGSVTNFSPVIAFIK